MTIEETAAVSSDQFPLAISDEAAAAELRGESIADEIDAPPPKKASPQKAAAKEEPEALEAADDSEDEDAGDPDLARKVLNGSDEEEDEGDDGPALLAGPLKQLLADQRNSYEEKLAAANERIASLEKLADKAGLTMENLVEQALSGKISREDLLEIASDIFYLAEPDRADPDTKLQLERKKLTIGQRKMQQELEQQQAELREKLENAERNARYQKLESEANFTTMKMADDIPNLLAVFGGDTSRIAAQALELAQRYAVNIDPDSPNIPDLSTAAMLKQLEREAEKLQNNLQSRRTTKTLKKAKSKALPVSDSLSQAEQDARDAEEMRAMMNG